MYRLFIVEDDCGIASSVAALASSWGLDARVCVDFSRVTEEFAEFDPHVVLLDISLPFAGGYHWCAEIRKVSKVPIVFISSATDSMNIVTAMNLGADDFIAKPFDSSVLMAKLNAVLRRAYDFSISYAVLSYKGAMLNSDTSALVYGGQTVELTKNEYRILACLMENKGKTVSREKLMERLWATDSFVDENTLTVNVNRLRKKLASVGLDGFITTKFGVGYILE